MKRQRHVFSTSEIPHLWAHQTQAEARNAQKNLYFEGDTIYSYGAHFAIAKHVVSGRKKAILLTTRKYSATTAGHIWAVRSAISKDIVVFHVPYPNGNVQENQASYLQSINELIVSANGRKMETTRFEDINTATLQLKEYRAFCKFYHLKTGRLPKLPEIDYIKLNRQDAAQTDRNRKREETRSLRYEAANAERLRLRDNWEQESVVLFDAWRRGERSTNDIRSLAYSYSDIPTMLRVVGETVETSQGAIVPITHAIRGLKFVRSVVSSGQPYKRNGYTLHLGHYAIDAIDIDGTLHAGCHVISLVEIERIAPELEAYAQAHVTNEVPNND